MFLYCCLTEEKSYLGEDDCTFPPLELFKQGPQRNVAGAKLTADKS